jgi:hypothetical protein
VAIAAGEAKNPRRNLPKAIKRVYIRILLFYICGGRSCLCCGYSFAYEKNFSHHCRPSRIVQGSCAHIEFGNCQRESVCHCHQERGYWWTAFRA